MKFLVLDGVGNPNHAAFADDIEALYLLSYGIKMLPKKGITPDGYFDYTVYPLEALWKQIEHTEQFDKNNLAIPSDDQTARFCDVRRVGGGDC